MYHCVILGLSSVNLLPALSDSDEKPVVMCTNNAYCEQKFDNTLYTSGVQMQLHIPTRKLCYRKDDRAMRAI